MKSEDFITRYMESDLWENPYYQKEIYEIEEPDPLPPDPVQEPNEDLLMWRSLRDKSPFKMDRAELDFVRGILENIANPRGGYIYRDFFYLGYHSTMGLLIPNGFKVHQAETDRAWKGYHMTGHIHQLGGLKNFKKDIHYFVDKPRGAAGVSSYKWNKRLFFRRWVLIYSDYYDYDNYWINDVVNALLNDMFMARVRVGLYMANYGEGEVFTYPPTIDKIGSMVIRLGYLVGEVKLLLRLARESQSMIPWSVPLNFGFSGTLPPQLIEFNWGYYKDALDSYFGIWTRVGKRGKGYGYQERDPVMSYINSSSGGDEGGSSPPPPPSSPPSGYSDRGYQE